MWNLALLCLFCFRYSFQDDSVTSQQNFDGSTSIKDDSTDDTNEQDDIYSFHSDDDDFTTVTYVKGNFRKICSLCDKIKYAEVTVL